MLGKVVGSVVSLLLVVGIVIGVVTYVNRDHNNSNGNSTPGNANNLSSHSKKVAQLCAPTDYKEACEKTLKSVNNTDDPKEYLKTAILATAEAAQKAFNLSESLLVEVDKNKNDPNTKMALEDCKDLLEEAVDELQAAFSTVGESKMHTMDQRVAELQNWLSAVISYQETCRDQFEDENSPFKSAMNNGMVDAAQLTSNALAIINALSEVLSSVGLEINIPSGGNSRKLLSIGDDCIPDWLSPTRRSLLAKHATGKITPNATVAQDGSGQFKTITQALASLPEKNIAPFIIYVKAGVYKEYPVVEKKQMNVFMYGDGPTKTIISGSHSNHTGYKTMKSATFAALGAGFTAKSMAFENTAGPQGHQAVALRVQADQAAFFDCKIDGYQDTLYVQTHRQFYNNCTISGTIDFIFGDASCVIQNSVIVVRKPMNNQQNTVTAQGRSDKHETTGLVLQNCQIVAEHKLYPERTKVPSYLGRPWKEYSRAIIMESEIGDVIQPAGWLPWTGDLYLKTLYFAEYGNRGPGAKTDQRVKWQGFHVLNNKNDVLQFTVGPFIQGQQWLNNSRGPATMGLAH